MGEAQWEGTGSGPVGQRGRSEREEKGDERASSEGTIAAGPTGTGCPARPHTPAAGAVLRGAHLSDAPLGVL